MNESDITANTINTSVLNANIISPGIGYYSELMILYTMVFISLLLIPLIVDMILNHNTIKFIVDTAAHSNENDFTIEELKTCTSVIYATSGLANITRRLVSIAIIAILGIAIFHTLVIGIPGSNPGESAQITNNILSMLAGTLAAMIGFYFGGRTAEKANEQRETQQLVNRQEVQKGQ